MKWYDVKESFIDKIFPYLNALFPKFTRKHFSMISFILLLMSIPLTLFVAYQAWDLRGRARFEEPIEIPYPTIYLSPTQSATPSATLYPTPVKRVLIK